MIDSRTLLELEIIAECTQVGQIKSTANSCNYCSSFSRSVDEADYLSSSIAQ